MQEKNNTFERENICKEKLSKQAKDKGHTQGYTKTLHIINQYTSQASISNGFQDINNTP